MRKGWKKNWYYIITMGMGIVVCAAALALLAFLLLMIKRNGLELIQGLFLLVPCITFGAGILFIRISRLKLSGTENSDEDAENAHFEDGWEEDVMQRIGILSDTHGLLRPEAVELLKECDYLIHGGDFNTEEIFNSLNQMGKLFAVRGNNDTGAWAEELEPIVRTEICGIRFAVVHDRKDFSGASEDVDVVVFGHSHKYYCEKEEGVLWLNPGSCGKRRFRIPVTLAVMEIGEKGFRVKQHILEEQET